jgi:hypothetical protein
MDTKINLTVMSVPHPYRDKETRQVFMGECGGKKIVTDNLPADGFRGNATCEVMRAGNALDGLPDFKVKGLYASTMRPGDIAKAIDPSGQLLKAIEDYAKNFPKLASIENTTPLAKSA